jgi:hypothetical protein
LRRGARGWARSCGSPPTQEHASPPRIAKLAGEALAWLDGNVDDRVTIDATVMATAALHGPNLYTGDFDDMNRFAAFFRAVKLFGLRP